MANRRVKIAILGFTEHRNQAPFLHDDWELWTINDLYYEVPDAVPYHRVRHFQIHHWGRQDPPRHQPGPFDFSEGPPHPRDPNHVKWLQETAKQCPLYLMEPAPEIPEARVLPLDEMDRYFTKAGGVPVAYWTNSISYEIALAIMELCPGGPGTPPLEGAEIGVWGVDMMMAGGEGSEYGYQRPSCEFFLGWAAGCGIPFHLPRESDLLKCAYPYGKEPANVVIRRVQHYTNEMKRRRGIMQQNIKQFELNQAELQGAINASEWFGRSLLTVEAGGDYMEPKPNAQKIAPQSAVTKPPDGPPAHLRKLAEKSDE